MVAALLFFLFQTHYGLVFLFILVCLLFLAAAGTASIAWSHLWHNTYLILYHPQYGTSTEAPLWTPRQRVRDITLSLLCVVLVPATVSGVTYFMNQLFIH